MAISIIWYGYGCTSSEKQKRDLAPAKSAMQQANNAGASQYSTENITSAEQLLEKTNPADDPAANANDMKFPSSADQDQQASEKAGDEDEPPRAELEKNNNDFKIYIKLHNLSLGANIQSQIYWGTWLMLQLYQNSFELSFPSGFSFHLVLFNTFDQYQSYSKKQISAAGYYDRKRAEAVLWTQPHIKNMLPVIFHESHHAILRGHFKNIPKWINEGLSEYFEGLKISSNRVRVAPQFRKDIKIKMWLRENSLPQLTSFFDIPDCKWQNEKKDRESVPPAIAWSLVYFLMESKDRRDILKAMLQDLKTNQKRSAQQLIHLHYPGGLENFEHEWRVWIVQSRRSHSLS
jgi:hypothetical protein